MTDATLSRPAPESMVRRPRLGFLGVGWIGLRRMEAIASSDVAQIVAVADTSAEAAARATASAPEAAVLGSLDALLESDLDGIVIATPSAFHAAQASTALERGISVLCQKPLARTAAETRRVVDAARAADRLLSVDLSYRHTAAMVAVRNAVRSGDIGSVFAADLVFHNAYGPDKPWFRQLRLSGGGCLMDLGTHLVDLVLWTLDHPRVIGTSGRLFAAGRPLTLPAEVVEDYAVATIELSGGTVVRIACSWNLHAGCDAVIEVAFHGTQGGVVMRNVNGSFYDFVAIRHDRTSSTTICEPPDDWGGRAALDWLARLSAGGRFDPEADRLVDLAWTLDSIYGR